MSNQRQTLEQQRAASAWKDVDGVPEAVQSKYGTLARKLPAMIQMNGLGATLAFLRAKGKGENDDGHTLIFNHLSTWVLGQLQAKGDNLLAWVREADMAAYRRATAEAIEYGIWLKRYVEARDWGSKEGDDE